MPNGTHKEACTQILIHTKHALEHGLNKIEIRPVYTYGRMLSEQTLVEDISVAFGSGKNLSLHSTTSQHLGPDQ